MQVSQSVFALRIPFTVPISPTAGVERFVYAYVILGENVWLVDTGVAGSAPKLLELVGSTGRSPEDVAGLLLTHSHIDHLGSARSLKEQTKALVYAHPAERSWIEDVETQARERPVPGFHQLCEGSVSLDHPLAHGQVIRLAANLDLKVMHTEGHSPGHVSFLLEQERVLFSGDAVPVPGDMPVYDDPLDSIESLTRLSKLGEVELLLSAWDRPRPSSESTAAIQQGIRVVEDIHRAVRATSVPFDSNPMAFCRSVLESLGLPEAFANPLVLRTIQGHFRYRDRASLAG